MIIPIVQERALSRSITEVRSLFLCREAVNRGAQSATIRETLKQLTRSNNAAIASESLRLLASQKMKDATRAND
jgi:hypothetical protein